MTYLTHGQRQPRRKLLYAAAVALGILGICALLWVGLIVTGIWLWGLVL